MNVFLSRCKKIKMGCMAKGIFLTFALTVWLVFFPSGAEALPDSLALDVGNTWSYSESKTGLMTTRTHTVVDLVSHDSLMLFKVDEMSNGTWNYTFWVEKKPNVAKLWGETFQLYGTKYTGWYKKGIPLA